MQDGDQVWVGILGSGVRLEQIQEMADSELLWWIEPPKIEKSSKYEQLIQCFPYFVLELKRTVVKLQRIWKEFGVSEVIKKALFDRRFGFNVKRTLFLTALNRWVESGPDRMAEKCKQAVRIGGVEEIEPHQLYWVMG